MFKWLIKEFKRIICDEKGFLPAIGLGVAALGWGASKLFGKKKKKEEPQKITVPPYQAPKTEEEYLKILRERIAGRGVGFREEELAAATSPYATARRGAFERYEAPAISAQASARGLGRATIPISQMRLGRQEVESDIGQRIAGLRLASEEQRRAEINQALTGLGAYTGLEAGRLAGRETLGVQTQLGTAQLQQQQQAQQAAEQQALFQNLISAGTLGVGAGTLAGKLTGAIQPSPLFGGIGLGDLGATGIGKTTGAMVNIKKIVDQLGTLSDEEREYLGLNK